MMVSMNFQSSGLCFAAVKGIQNHLLIMSLFAGLLNLAGLRLVQSVVSVCRPELHTEPQTQTRPPYHRCGQTDSRNENHLPVPTSDAVISEETKSLGRQ
jgi:hypothetical protein